MPSENKLTDKHPDSPKVLSPEKEKKVTKTEDNLNTAEEQKHRAQKKKGEGVKSLPPLLKPDELIRERYKVERMIGGGGFGQIFLAFDTSKNNHVAIKIEPQYTDARRMKLEQIVLVLLRGKSHIPTILSSGKAPNGGPFIVMQLLGRNLSEMRRREKSRKLSHPTVYRAAQQVLSGLRSIHDSGYLHRDVKPSNCCVGRTNPRIVYIVDFGMARLFVDGNGNPRPARQSVGFRGTIRYVSLNVHAKRESGPGDDLIGLMYSIVELAEGSLPWTQIKDIRNVEESKLKIGEKLYENQPPAFAEYYKHVNSLVYDQTPDYDMLLNILKRCLPEDFDNSTPYDWEIERPTKSLFLDLAAPTLTPANPVNPAVSHKPKNPPSEKARKKPSDEQPPIEKPRKSIRKKPPTSKSKQDGTLIENTQRTSE